MNTIDLTLLEAGEKPYTVTTLHDEAWGKEIAIVFMAGAVMPSHKAPGPVHIAPVSGVMEIAVGEERIPLKPGKVLCLESGVSHDVRAVETGVLRVTLFK